MGALLLPLILLVKRTQVSIYTKGGVTITSYQLVSPNYMQYFGALFMNGWMNSRICFSIKWGLQRSMQKKIITLLSYIVETISCLQEVERDAWSGLSGLAHIMAKTNKSSSNPNNIHKATKNLSVAYAILYHLPGVTTELRIFCTAAWVMVNIIQAKIIIEYVQTFSIETVTRSVRLLITITIISLIGTDKLSYGTSIIKFTGVLYALVRYVGSRKILEILNDYSALLHRKNVIFKWRVIMCIIKNNMKAKVKSSMRRVTEGLYIFSRNQGI